MSAPYDVIEGTAVDVAEPYPVRHASRIWGWHQASGPQLRYLTRQVAPNADAFTDVMVKSLLMDGMRSFAIVERTDKLTADGHPPIIGVVLAEPAGPTERQMHIAGKRKNLEAFDEAIEIIVNKLWETEPTLQRLVCVIPTENRAATQRAMRSGFKETLLLTRCVRRRAEAVTGMED